MSLGSEEQKRLFAAYCEGDDDAFTALYGELSPRVYGYIRKRISKESDATEILQTVFLKMHRFKHSYNDRYPLSAWVFTLTRNILIDFYRENGRGIWLSYTDDIAKTAEIQGVGLDQNPANANKHVDLSHLNGDERKLLEDRFFQGLSYKELSEKLGKSPGSLRKRVERLLKRLRNPVGSIT